MELKWHLCILVAFILGRFTASAEKCPSHENISPCTCKMFGSDAYVTCTGLQNAEQLKDALAGMKGLKLYSLEIKESNLGDVPGNMFKDTRFEELKFTYTKLTSLGDEENLPLSGLENSLTRFIVVEAFWDYDKPLTQPIPLDHLKKLNYLSSENNIIPNLGNEYFAKGPVTLRSLYLDNCLAKEVGDKAFAELKNLRTLSFTGNSVTLKRSALPPNPIYLDSLDLGENEIVELPSDIFTNLPALKYLYLDDNALQHLPEGTFKPILKQLDFLFVHSNPVECGSKIKWLVKENLQDRIIGTCATPAALSGRDIDTLTLGDISD